MRFLLTSTVFLTATFAASSARSDDVTPAPRRPRRDATEEPTTAERTTRREHGDESAEPKAATQRASREDASRREDEPPLAERSSTAPSDKRTPMADAPPKVEPREPVSPPPSEPAPTLARAGLVVPTNTNGHRGTFVFGSYGRVLAASDAAGRPARDSDIVAYGSRVDAVNYVELELRREDHWEATGIDTRIVSTLAIGNSIFHHNGVFDAQVAVRNLYLEAMNLGHRGLSAWAGSRMYRGDDIYLLNFWPLDNLNTMGAGLRFEAPTHTIAQLHIGFGQPDSPFYKQRASRPSPLNQFGAATIDLLDRQRWIGSARLEQPIRFGEKVGMKLVAYGEAHRLPAGERETARDGVFEAVPAEAGFVVGGQLGAWTGERNSHLNVFVRYAGGLAAYGEFATPSSLGVDRTTSGARELQVAFGGNYELGRFAVMAGGYLRSFRNASRALDASDVDEGSVIVRPQVWFRDWLGIGVEGGYQLQQRGTLVVPEEGGSPAPIVATMPRFAVMPFISPAGRGSFSRPMMWLIYSAGFRDAGARALYPVDDPFRTRAVEHFFGVGAEWWFGSSSYGGTLQ
ncbi:MAG: carbohydrate porin [Deltaproteobacteria bacterium]|nr:carbohydrate porin [Deltaproteobacteria bacterium]